MIVQYCENCGKGLDAQARFCGRCGKPVLQQPPAPPPTPPVMPPPTSAPARQPVAPPTPEVVSPCSEWVVAALPTGIKRTGFLGVRAQGWVLVLTNLRILVAEQTAELMRINARQAKAAAKQEGKGFFSQWGAVIGSYGSQRYLQMQPQAILTETPGNYFIANNQVHSVKLKENYDPEEGVSDVDLTLVAGGTKLELTYRQTNKRQIQQILQQTLGNLVR